MALAEVELVPFWYFVEDVSSTVTFWPADVVSVKVDLDTLPTVADAPRGPAQSERSIPRRRREGRQRGRRRKRVAPLMPRGKSRDRRIVRSPEP